MFQVLLIPNTHKLSPYISRDEKPQGNDDNANKQWKEYISHIIGRFGSIDECVTKMLRL